MDEDRLKFVLEYAVLCKKHGLCVVAEAGENLYLAEYDEGWVESVALGEGAEVYAFKVQSEREEKLQDLRGFLFRLKGFLEAEAAGFPRLDLVWVREAIEIVKTLQLEV